MDNYMVNGVEIGFDTFDVDSIERYEDGISKVSAQLKRDEPGESTIGKLRRGCNAVMDFFDDVVGEGTSSLIFGERTNVKECTDAYHFFVKDVSGKMHEFKAELDTAFAGTASAPINRQQRRAAERK